MECCNSKNSHKDFATQCNACGKTDMPVKRETLEHLLKEDVQKNLVNYLPKLIEY